MKFILFVIFLTLVMFVNALDDPKQCNAAIVKSITSRKSCPTGILTQLQSSSPFTYVLNPNGTVPSWVKCAKGVVDNVSCDGKSAKAHVYIKNTNTSIPDIVNNYSQNETSCGHLVERDLATQKLYEINIVSAFPCFCYYRCTPYKTGGAEYAACAVPVARQTERATLQCVEDCRKTLAEVGLSVKLQAMTPCAE